MTDDEYKYENEKLRVLDLISSLAINSFGAALLVGLEYCSVWKIKQKRNKHFTHYRYLLRLLRRYRQNYLAFFEKFKIYNLN